MYKYINIFQKQLGLLLGRKSNEHIILIEAKDQYQTSTTVLAPKPKQ